MTAADTVVATAIHAWNSSIERATARFSPLSDEDLQREIAPGKNRLLYVWGHLIAVHDGMLPLLAIGPRLHKELDAQFLKNPDRAVAHVPTAAELNDWWKEVNARLRDGFAAFSTDDWLGKHTAVSAEDFAANPLRNRLSVLLSRSAHVAYHLGQMAIAVKS